MTSRSLKLGGRIDRYVAMLFAKSYLAAFFLVVGIYLIIKMAAELDEVLKPGPDGESPILDVVRLYALELPFLYLQMSPFVTLVAGLFTAAKMTRFNEVVAALNAGVSSRRLLLPVFAGAVVLAGGMFGLREWATDELGIRRDALKYQLEEGLSAPIYEDFGLRDRSGQWIRISEYRSSPEDPLRCEIRGLKAGFRSDEGLSRIHADVARPLTPLEEGRWRLEGGSRIDVGETLVTTSIDVLEDLRFTPEDVELYWKAHDHPLDVSFSEARQLLVGDPEKPQFRTLFHYLMTFPLAGLVLLAVGLPFVIGQERGKALERIAVGLFLCMTYFGVDFVTRTLGLQGHLGPIHAGWLPVLAFGSLGVVLYGSMRS